MNNSKWEKLFDSLVKEFDSVFIKYKLIGREKVLETEFNFVDFYPFFIEPILYKEIEWVEFPEKTLMINNKRISKQTISEHSQDITKIKNLINKIGDFDIEKYNGFLRLYGYK
ncbi:hypothetical protein TAESTU_30685 [Tenacibaculum aestuarii]